MSDVGLSSNIYRISNKYLDHFNSFLVEVNYNPNDISEEHLRSVKNILLKLSDEKSKNFQIQMVYIVLDNYLKSKKLDTSQVLKELLQAFETEKHNEKENIEKIEMLAAALDKECDYAFSRIQGR